MSYEYSDPKRESDPHALPDVEVFGPEAWSECPSCGATILADTWYSGGCSTCGAADNDFHGQHSEPHCVTSGYGYAFGSPGCGWDSDPVGPFESYDAALAAAREVASD